MESLCVLMCIRRVQNIEYMVFIELHAVRFYYYVMSDMSVIQTYH